MAASAEVSEPRYVETVRASGFTGRSTDIGVVYDLMIHDIDLLLTLVGSEVKNVSALGLAVLGQHEDVAQARVEFANGCVANLSALRVSFAAAPRRQMHVWSARGFAAIDFASRTASVVGPCDAVAERHFDYETLEPQEKAAFPQRLFRDILRVESLTVEPCNALAEELRDFCDSVRKGRARRHRAHGRNAIALAETILDSIATHRWHGHEGGPIGPQATPPLPILRGPHWEPAKQPMPARREAG